MTLFNKKTEQTYPADRLSSKFTQSVSDYTALSNNVLSSTRAAASNQSFSPIQKNNLTEQINSLFVNSSSNIGCYKNTKSPLILQTGLTDITVDSCAERAILQGYDGMSIKKNQNGVLGCYLLNNVDEYKSGGIAINPQATTTFSFTTSPDANMGGLLWNGQVGIFKDNISNPITADLTGNPICDMRNNIGINNSNIIASYGVNCSQSPTPSDVSQNTQTLLNSAIDSLQKQGACAIM
jgi:hypothetical protein